MIRYVIHLEEVVSNPYPGFSISICLNHAEVWQTRVEISLQHTSCPLRKLLASGNVMQRMVLIMKKTMSQYFVSITIPCYMTVCSSYIVYSSLLRYDYTLAREYNWNVKNKASKGYEETYFFTFREDGVYYNELETRCVPICCQLAVMHSSIHLPIFYSTEYV